MKHSARLAVLSAILAACGVFQTTGFADIPTDLYTPRATGDWGNVSTWFDDSTPPTGANATAVPGGSADVRDNYVPGDVVTVSDAENVGSLQMTNTTLNITGSLTGFNSVYYCQLNTSSTINLSGTFNQTGGNHSSGFQVATGSTFVQTGSSSSLTTGTVFQPDNGSSTVPSYSISGGTATFNEGIQSGGGLMVQTGGTVTLNNGQLILGNYASATWKISGGTLDLHGGNTWLGNGTVGTGTLQVIGHTAAVDITGGNTIFDEAFVLTHNAGTHGQLAFQIDNGGTSTPQIIDHNAAIFNAGSLLDMSWVPGTTALANAKYQLFEAPTAIFYGTNLALASNPEDADFSFAFDTTSVPGETILEATLLVSIPEPATLGVLGLGAFGLFCRRRRAFNC